DEVGAVEVSFLHRRILPKWVVRIAVACTRQRAGGRIASPSTHDACCRIDDEGADVSPVAHRSDPRTIRTRASLVEALRSLLHEKPFHDVTVKDIAARAAVHRATFYAHFDDKHAMVGDLFRERFAALLGDHLPKESSSPREFVRALVLAVLEHRRAAAS